MQNAAAKKLVLKPMCTTTAAMQARAHTLLYTHVQTVTAIEACTYCWWVDGDAAVTEQHEFGVCQVLESLPQQHQLSFNLGSNQTMA